MSSRGAIDGLVATAATPDEQVFARIDGRTRVTVSLAPGYWHRASSSDLERQLTRLGKLLFVSRTREYHRIRSIDFGEPVTGERPALGRRDQAYREARSQLTVEGEAADGAVRITCVGMEQWVVRLAGDLTRRLDEEQFGRAVSEAATRMVERQFAGISALKRDIYADEPA